MCICFRPGKTLSGFTGHKTSTVASVSKSLKRTLIIHCIFSEFCVLRCYKLRVHKYTLYSVLTRKYTKDPWKRQGMVRSIPDVISNLQRSAPPWQPLGLLPAVRLGPSEWHSGARHVRSAERASRISWTNGWCSTTINLHHWHWRTRINHDPNQLVHVFQACSVVYYPCISMLVYTAMNHRNWYAQW